jgi:hypothetical protein
VIAHEVAGGVTDRVARRPAEAQQLGLGLVPVADGGQVLVAVAVDLAGAHHHVALPVPEQLKHAAVGIPVLDDAVGVGPSDRGRVGGQGGQPVGDRQVGLEGGPRQAAADQRHVADRVAEDLAVAPERFGDGDGAVVGAGDILVAHRVASWLI